MGAGYGQLVAQWWARGARRLRELRRRMGRGRSWWLVLPVALALTLWFSRRWWTPPAVPTAPAASALPSRLFEPRETGAAAGDEAPSREPLMPAPPPTGEPRPAVRAAEGNGAAGLGGPCGGVRVRAITTSADDSWSFASVAAPGEADAKLRRVGERLGSWVIRRIEWDRLELGRGGESCTAGLLKGLRSAPDAARNHASGVAIVDAEEPALPWELPWELREGLRKRSETEWVVTPAALRALEKGAELLFSGLALTPMPEGAPAGGAAGDGPHGLRLDRLPSESLLETLGLRQGDIVWSLNDEPARSLEAVAAALLKAKEEGKLLLAVERGGRTYQWELLPLKADLPDETEPAPPSAPPDAEAAPVASAPATMF